MSIRYAERLTEAGIKPSVGSIGDRYDNALAVTTNGLFKAEVINRQSWRSIKAVEFATLHAAFTCAAGHDAFCANQIPTKSTHSKCTRAPTGSSRSSIA